MQTINGTECIHLQFWALSILARTRAVEPMVRSIRLHQRVNSHGVESKAPFQHTDPSQEQATTNVFSCIIPC